MKFVLVTLLAALHTVQSSRYGVHHGQRRRAAQAMRATATARMGRRKLFFGGGGGLMKMDYLMDFRASKQPTPPTPRPTPSPTKKPDVDPTPSPSKPPKTEKPTDPDETPEPTSPPETTGKPTSPPDTPPPATSPPDTPEPTSPPDTPEPTSSPVAPPPGETPEPTSSPVAPPPGETPEPTATPTTLEPTASPTPSPTATPTTAAPTTPLPTATPTTPAPTNVPVGACEILDFLFVEEPEDEQLDPLGEGYGPGSSILFEGNDVFVESQLVGTHSGKCTALEDTEDEDNLYCITEFEFEGGGKVLVQGVFFELVAIGGTGCYAGVQGKINPEDDPLDLGGYGYSFEMGDDSCTDDGFLEGPFLESFDTSTEEYINWDSGSVVDAGDIIVFDNNPFTTGSGSEGFVEGECLMLYDPVAETTNGDAPFCTMTFFSEDGDILMVQGPFDNMVIVAGLGCYFGVTGSLVGSEGETGFQYELNFDEGNSPGCDSDIFSDVWTEPYGDFYVDYIENDEEEDPGEAYVFENKPVTIASGGSATLAGKCLLLAEADQTYCNIVYTLDQGSIAVQGFFDDMIVVGGTGCFRDLAGSVSAEEGEDGFIYTWSISR